MNSLKTLAQGGLSDRQRHVVGEGDQDEVEVLVDLDGVLGHLFFVIEAVLDDHLLVFES